MGRAGCAGGGASPADLRSQARPPADGPRAPSPRAGCRLPRGAPAPHTAVPHTCCACCASTTFSSSPHAPTPPPFSSRQVPSLCEDLLSSIDQPLKIAKDKESGQDYLLCDYNRDGDSYRLGAAAHKGCTTQRAGHCSHPLYPTPSSSPWSNTYDPPLDDGAMPSARLRELEIQVGRGFALQWTPKPPASSPARWSARVPVNKHCHQLTPPHPCPSSPPLARTHPQANGAFDTYRELYFEGGVSSVYLWDLDHGFAGVVLIKKGVSWVLCVSSACLETPPLLVALIIVPSLS